MNEPLRPPPAILGPPADPPVEGAASLRRLLESYERGIERAEKRLAAETNPAERKLIETGLRLTREHRDGIAARLRDAEEKERNMAKKKTESPAPDDKSIERKKYTDTLPVRLNDVEIVERAQEQSRTLQEIEAMEADLKTKAQHGKAALGEKEAEVRKLSIEIRDRATYRPVDCERIYDYRAGTVTEIRLDTGETVNTRAMNYAEMQRQLPLGDDGKAKDEELDEEDGEDPEGEGTQKLEAEADEEGAKMGGRRRRKGAGRKGAGA